MSDDDKPRFTVIDGDGQQATEKEGPTGANDEAIKLKISQLEEEHKDLDQAISSMEERMPYERMTIARMKKRKLALRDQIQELYDRLFPDIIA